MENDIIIDGIKIHYEETGPGNGPAVVIMHGWGCSHTTVRTIASILEQGLRVINVDLPGHGKSDEPDSTWGVERFTVIIERLVSELGLSNPALVGHSFGGRIAILYASRNPTGKIMLVDSAGIKPKRKPSYYAKVWSFKIMKSAARLFLSPGKAKEVIEKWRSTKGSADYQASSPRMRSVMSRCVNEDLKKVMPAIKVPVLLVWGQEDTATPVSDAKTMERLIPDAGLVSFPGCGHYSFLDNPIGFKAVTREFFKSELSPKSSLLKH